MRPLSALTARFGESVIREMTRLADAAGAINLAQGFPDWDPPEPVLAAARRALAQGRNQYPVTYGEPELRRAIAARWAAETGQARDPEAEITVTCGATEAMAATLMALCDPGDEVVILEPFYENYGPGCLLAGAVPRWVRLHPPHWRWREAELAEAFGPRTKAVVLNTPHNPTGRVFDAAELAQVAKLCQAHDAWAVTDEVYAHITHGQASHQSLAALPGMAARTAVISSLSKTYSATGWRVGWAVAPPELTARIRKVHDFLTVGAPTPFQAAAVAALGLPDEYHAGLAARFAPGRDALLPALAQAGFGVYEPQGAYYVLAEASAVRARLGAADDTALARLLIERAAVAAVPGGSFFSRPEPGVDYLRFAFARSPEVVARAAARLAAL